MKGEKKPKKVENLTFDFLAMSCLDPLWPPGMAVRDSEQESESENSDESEAPSQRFNSKEYNSLWNDYSWDGILCYNSSSEVKRYKMV